MLKGIWAERSFAYQLIMIFFLAISGTLFFSSLGLALAAGIYDVQPEEVLNIFSQSGTEASREMFKLVQGFSTLGSFLFPALLGAFFVSKEPQKLLGLDQSSRPAWLWGLLLIIMAYSMGAVSDILFRLSSAIPIPFESWRAALEQSQDLMLQQYESILRISGPLDFLQVLLIMAVLPAVAEEALFRGLLQPLMQKRLGIHGGIWLTAILFGLLHQQFLAFLSIVSLGAVLGYLRSWTGNLWLPTLLHFFNNAQIVVLVYFFDYDYRQALESDQFSYVELGVLAAIFGICVMIARRISWNTAG